MSTHELLQTIAQVAGAGAALVAITAFLMRLAQERTAFEDSIAHEYRQIVRPHLVKVLLSKDPAAEASAHLDDVYAYLDLSNEQVFLRMLGRVGSRTWRQWSDGIEGNIGRPDRNDPRGRPGFKDGWKLVRESRPDDFHELQLLIDTGYQTDPRKWSPWLRRRLRRELSAATASRRPNVGRHIVACRLELWQQRSADQAAERDGPE